MDVYLCRIHAPVFYNYDISSKRKEPDNLHIKCGRKKNQNGYYTDIDVKLLHDLSHKLLSLPSTATSDKRLWKLGKGQFDKILAECIKRVHANIAPEGTIFVEKRDSNYLRSMDVSSDLYSFFEGKITFMVDGMDGRGLCRQGNGVHLEGAPSNGNRY